MFLLLPAFAWIVSRVTARSRNFPQHLYFALHVHAAWFAAWLLRELEAILLSPRFMASTRWLGYSMLVYSVAYSVFAFQTAYAEGFWKSTLKMSAVIIGYVVVFSTVLAAIALFQFTFSAPPTE